MACMCMTDDIDMEEYDCGWMTLDCGLCCGQRLQGDSELNTAPRDLILSIFLISSIIVSVCNIHCLSVRYSGLWWKPLHTTTDIYTISFIPTTWHTILHQKFFIQTTQPPKNNRWTCSWAIKWIMDLKIIEFLVFLLQNIHWSWMPPHGHKEWDYDHCEQYSNVTMLSENTVSQTRWFTPARAVSLFLV